MKALMLKAAEVLQFDDAPEPVAGAGECLVDVAAVGICGSDMHAYLGHDPRRPVPIILGHEAAGVVRNGAWAGKRVTVNPLVTCGTCRACASGRENLCPDRQIISMPPRPGAFAEVVAIPEANLVEVPQHISLQIASLAEPLAVCWHAVRLASELPYLSLPQARCLVIGGGAIGVGSALALQAFGAGEVVVSEPGAARADYVSERCGLTVRSPGDVEENAWDLVIDAVGLPITRQGASAAVLPGGAICHIGLGHGEGGLDVRRATLQEITFFGTYTYTAKDFRETAAAMFDGRFGALDWMEEQPLAEGAKAFQGLKSGDIAAPKVVLVP